MQIHTLAFILKTAFNIWLIPLNWYILLVICIALYILTRYNNSIATGNASQEISNQIPKHQCNKCKILMFYRMKHCAQCERCIHKYDHHCYLMFVCIGEFNQKYYILFLMFEAVLELVAGGIALTFIPNQIQADQNGIQHFSLKFFLYTASIYYSVTIIVVCSALFKNHIGYILNNTTSWQQNRREKITYFKKYEHVKYPFDKGYLHNIIEVFKATRQHPIQWMFPKIQNENYQKSNQKKASSDSEF